ncbi:MAG TPA: LamG domain-containing protein, partial [Candidatus Synoicihabitans sp.]|nr:LamG domain-containing protein [Candidatus Synoicihabitans sp.]
VEWLPLIENTGRRLGLHAATLTNDPSAPRLIAGVGGSIANVLNFEDFQISDRASFQFGTGDFTVSGWVYPTTVSYGADGQGTIISKNFTGYEILIYESVLYAYIAGASNLITGSAIAANAWYHITLRRSGGNVALFRNAVLEGTLSAGGSVSQDGTATIIGFRPGGSSVQRLAGRVQRFGWWSRGLATDEIAYLYNGGVGRDYPFV